MRKNDILKTFAFLRKKIWRSAIALKSKKVHGKFQGLFILALSSSVVFHQQNCISDFISLFCLGAALQIRTDQQSITTNPWPLPVHIYHLQPVTFWINLFLLLFSEAAVPRCSSKQVSLDILQYSQENIYVGVSF